MTTRNPLLVDVILALKKASKKNNAAIYAAAARSLGGHRSRRSEVNVGKIGRATKNGDKVLVPGKVLGAGDLSHRVVVGAFSFSAASVDKIQKAGGEAVSLSSLLKKYPEGKGVLLLGG